MYVKDNVSISTLPNIISIVQNNRFSISVKKGSHFTKLDMVEGEPSGGARGWATNNFLLL